MKRIPSASFKLLASSSRSTQPAFIKLDAGHDRD
jgi:hypothetical protein